MRLIKADALIAQFHKDAMRLGGLEDPWDLSAIETEIESAPTIDAVPVVRCSECVLSENCTQEDVFRLVAGIENPFCCVGKRKDGEG